MRTLPIWVGDRIVADIGVDDDGLYHFSYREGVSAHEVVSIAFPLDGPTDDVFEYFPGPLDQHLPEGALREYLLSAIRKNQVVGLDEIYFEEEFELLERVGSFLVGRVRIGRAPPGAGGKSAPTLDRAKALGDLEAGDARDFLTDCFDRFANRSGISGVQPKVLADGRPQDRMTLPAEDLIIKFEAPEYPGIAVNEYFCLQAARNAGLESVDAELSADGRRLLVQRFDRDEEGGPIGHEDFCALRTLPAHHKYFGSYADAFETAAGVLSPLERVAGQRELFTSIVVSMLVENGDAHMKNFGVLYADPARDVRLCPVYDVVTTTVYLPSDTPALTLFKDDKEKAWPDRETLIGLASAARITRGRAEKYIDRAIVGVCAAAEELRAYVATHPRHEELAEKMLKAWSRGLERVGASPEAIAALRAPLTPLDESGCSPQP